MYLEARLIAKVFSRALEMTASNCMGHGQRFLQMKRGLMEVWILGTWCSATSRIYKGV